ncbi:sensor histidine kinase [Pseudonocardia xishanensis]|uniref:sensor histidine kinase n=1 Tax=Pseudonocardia xishanensis TaxID=630995 RepID=UPI0031EFCA87
MTTDPACDGGRMVQDEGPGAMLSGLRLDQLLDEVQERLGEMRQARDRVQGLLDAVLAVASGIELETTLERIVQAAVDLVDARYGGLGVLAPDGSLARFIDVGLDARTRAGLLGHPPEGKGLIGQLIVQPEPLRMADLESHAASVGVPPGHPEMHSFLGVPIRVRDAVYGNLYLTEKRGGGEFTADDEVMVQALAAAAGIAVQNADLFEQTRLRQLWLEALGEVRSAVLADAAEPDVLALLAQRTQELSRSVATVVALGPEAEGRFRIGARIGLDSDPELDGLLREVAGSRSAVLAATLDPPLDGFGPTVAVPLRAAERVIGVIVGLRGAGAPAFRPDEVPLLDSFAQQVALALELGERNRAQRQLVVLADRDRIARDLHDHVIQRLFATGLRLQSSLKLDGGPRVRERISQAVDDLDRTVREIRTSIFDLQTEGGDGVRRRLLDAVTEAGEGVRTSVRTAGPVDTVVPPELAAHVAAVAREAVANAVRHGHAGSVTVTLDLGPAELLLEVVDDGVGIPEGVARSGLHNLADRAAECHGALEVDRRPEGGTRLSWRVPL